MRYQLKTAKIKESTPQFIGLPDDAIILSAEYRPVTMLIDSKPSDTRLLFLQYLLPIGEEEPDKMKGEVQRVPKWTVHYNIVSPENGKWIGRGWEFFDSGIDAQDCYDRHIRIGNCPSKRPYHPMDSKNLGAGHSMRIQDA